MKLTPTPVDSGAFCVLTSEGKITFDPVFESELERVGAAADASAPASSSALNARSEPAIASGQESPSATSLAKELERLRVWVDGADARRDRRRAADRPTIDVVAVTSANVPTPSMVRETTGETPVDVPSARSAASMPPQRGTETVIVNVRATREGSVASLDIRHRSLGPIHMEVTISGGRMIVHATVQDSRAVSVLMSNETSLRDAVREEGLDLHVLRVCVHRKRHAAKFVEDARRRRREEP